MRLVIALFLALILCSPVLSASDEWDELFSELKTDSKSNAAEVIPVKEEFPTPKTNDTESIVSVARPVSKPSAPIMPSRQDLGLLETSSKKLSPRVSLSNIDSSKAQIDALGRRVDDLERENRLMTEKVRNLTRSMDDLKRKI